MPLPSLQKKIVQRIDRLPLSVALQLPSGKRLGPRQAAVTLLFQDAASLAGLVAGRIGAVAEAMVEGRVRFEGTLRDLMHVANALLPGNPTHSNTRWWTRTLHHARSMGAHTPGRDAQQIQFHYDVSDDFYALWLDPRRVYSCAYYRQPNMSLAQAQEAKLDHICRKLLLQPGERFLDIGAGWGGLLLWAAEHYGVDATGITLSHHQHAYVQRVIVEKGLQDRVRMLLCDYRELQVSQPFDKVASVGMFEHVGRAHIPTYFATVRRLLRPGGWVLNHGITAGGTDNTELGAGMGAFIEKYIFPGGELLHVSSVLNALAGAGLEMVDAENLRPHYARTLWAWSDALEARLDEARRVLSADDGMEQAQRVVQAYRLYLAGSAMGFERGWMSLYQLLATRPNNDIERGALPGAQSDYPFTRDYLYSSKDVPCSTNSNPALPLT
ncbi:class I SAM-dependent methyltransferase [Simplicispira psychrophila]|uniref:class I SAM-dependent methyltransferase n=1 Tax=Simplicispira psychrophila TaxID=80882 RepID=UPI000690265D|nr:class I SAM-dependent methyltransferase [Simplicispira psychrophila]